MILTLSPLQTALGLSKTMNRRVHWISYLVLKGLNHINILYLFIQIFVNICKHCLCKLCISNERYVQQASVIENQSVKSSIWEYPFTSHLRIKFEYMSMKIPIRKPICKLLCACRLRCLIQFWLGYYKRRTIWMSFTSVETC